VIFAGAPNGIAFDYVAFGAATPSPVPEPCSLLLLASGALMLAGAASRRRTA
jgi:hypothetical protein